MSDKVQTCEYDELARWVEGQVVPFYKRPSPCMAKIDRLGWVAGIAFSAYGARFGVRVNDADMIADVARRLPPGSQVLSEPEVQILYSLYVAPPARCTTIRRFNILFGGSTILARTVQAGVLPGAFEESVRSTCALVSHELLFVRSAVVVWAGRAIIILGPEGSGRATLAAAMVRCGAEHHSDFWGVIDPHGMVRPDPAGPAGIDYCGPLSADAPPFHAPAPANEVVPLGAVVVTAYRAGARFRPRTLTEAGAAVQLLRYAPRALAAPRHVMDKLPNIVTGVLTVMGQRGEAADAARAIIRRVDRRS